jgi:hypothetical protein
VRYQLPHQDGPAHTLEHIVADQVGFGDTHSETKCNYIGVSLVRGKTAANIQQKKVPPLMKKASNPLKSTYQKIAAVLSLDELYYFLRSEKS